MTHFVYIWMDRTRKMFYVGSHSGSLDEQYLSSSRWLSGEIRYRPNEFKRKILSIHPNKNSARKEEYRLISMMKEHEYGTRYYNIRSGRKKGCIPPNKGKPMSLEQRQKISLALTGKPANNQHTKGCRLIG